MKKLIFNAFSYIDKQSLPINLSEVDKNKVIESYLKCSVVSLISSKLNNDDCDVALITNIQIPYKFEKTLKQYNIKIFIVEYNEFNFNKEMKWSAAFYKLCALNYVVNKLDYEKYLMLDTDTYINGKLSDLWLECDKKILLYDIQHNLSNKQAKQMNKEYFELYNEEVYLTNYGGEFIAGNKKLLNEFLDNCKKIYQDMNNTSQKTLHGDEFIICCAANSMQNKIKNANAYIYRYWTGYKFYLVSTNFVYNKVCILHLPSEKDLGFKSVYNFIIKNGKLPNEKIVFKKFGLPKVKKTLNINYVYNIIRKKLNNK